MNDLERIRAELDSPDWETRYLATKRLGQPGAATGGADALLARAGQDAHVSVRRQAAIGLGGFAAPGSVSALTSMLRDPDAWVRIRSIQSLARIGRPESAGSLEASLANETDVRVLATLVKNLGSFRDPAHVPRIREFLGHPDARVRANAIEGLAHYAREEVLEALLPYLDSDNFRIRANTARAIYPLYPERSTGAFRGMIASLEPLCRASAAFNLGVLCRPELVPVLLEMAGDESWMVQRNVADALCALGSAVQPRLMDLAGSSGIGSRILACKVLGRIGDEAAYRRVVDLLDDPEGEVRHACEEALDRLEERLGIQSTHTKNNNDRLDL